MGNHKNAKIFDIRDTKDFKEEHIKNSLNLNFAGSSINYHIVKKYIKNHIIICSNDNKIAKIAILKLRNEKAESVYILKGGIKSWKNAGFPIVKKKLEFILFTFFMSDN